MLSELKESMSEIKVIIDAINTKFDQAFNSKNAEAIGALYDANAVVMPAPAGAPVIGATAIQAFFAGLIEAGVIEHQLTLSDAVEDGNLAFQRGLWAGAMVGADGVKQTLGGNVHLVYRKQADGGWKALTHIWN
jgi:ketosteroid isomerase-like protein